MKIKSRYYALALADLILDAKSSDKRIIENFFALLQKNGNISKAKEIIALTENILLVKSGNKKIILETALKVSRKHILKGILKKNDIVEEKINPELIAGIKIIINNEKQLDFSLQKKINEIFT